jgi:hypothetical protein
VLEGVAIARFAKSSVFEESKLFLIAGRGEERNVKVASSALVGTKAFLFGISGEEETWV